MTRSRRTSQVLGSALAAALLALSGCSGDTEGSTTDSSDSSGSSGSSEGSESSGSSEGSEGSAAEGGNEFSALGVSFSAPEGWESLDPEDSGVTEEETGEIAEGLNLTPEQLAQAVQSVDLFVVDGEGPQDGFLNNINVLGQTGALPPSDQIEQQFGAMGAEVGGVAQEETDLGEVTAVEYSLPVQDSTVEGVSYLFAQDDEVVTITVSTSDRATTTEIGDGILASLSAG